MEARTFREPLLNLGMFVGSVIIEDQMKINGGGKFAIDLPQKLQEFLMPMEDFLGSDLDGLLPKSPSCGG